MRRDGNNRRHDKHITNIEIFNFLVNLNKKLEKKYFFKKFKQIC